ncbi:MAG: HNH endonuclease [Chloroflexi bacterium]|nr:HNH endonuclease [Chloroflexota bacterium]
MSTKERNQILAELAHYTGRIMPAAFFKKTASYAPSLGIERFHNLVTGIFKPAWSEYTLCIRVTPKSRYQTKDEVLILPDGRWMMDYSPRVGGLDHAENQSLVKCKDDRVSFGVIQQVTDKTEGSTYKVLGLGIVTNYNSMRDVFIVESADLSALAQVSNAIPDATKRYEMLLYAQLTNDFRPFIQEDRMSYVASQPKRDDAFREVLLTEYDFACAICDMKFVVDNLHEAQAAHIVPKNKNGTDDPRNGLTLCRAHHWAFDIGLFTLTTDYAVQLSPVVLRADIRKLDMQALEGQHIHQPQREVILPHPKALEWHQSHVYRA